MSDRDALLAAILSDPADDLPRLIYADWLNENGESERAEFVRVQVESSRCKPCDQLHCWPGNSACSGECELRRRERELFTHVAVFDWFPVPTDRMGATCRRKRNEIAFKQFESSKRINSVRTEPATEQTYYVSRGFISSTRLSWADWLRHHEALCWHPKQTVECPACWPDESGEIDTAEKTFGCETCGGSNNPFRRGTGRIPQPFVATAQPITEVELTTWPIQDSVTHLASHANAFFSGVTFTRFTRVKCPACNGVVPRAPDGRRSKCRKCNGEPLNKWTCDKWPTITFKMP